MKKEIPILFSTPMVQAILAGRKTMTRRIIKMDDLLENPDRFRSAGDSREWDVPRPAIKYDDRIWFAWELKNSNARTWIERCKYKPGDIMWVRESAANLNVDFPSVEPYWVYRADIQIKDQHGPVTWKPSIHMPKSACRIWLEVINVRVERLHDITGTDDYEKEGIEPIEYLNPEYPDEKYFKNYGGIYGGEHLLAEESFLALWESINGRGSWKINPWVWVVSFKVLSTTGRPEFTPTLIASPGEGAVIVEPAESTPKTIGQLLTEAITLNELNPEVVEKQLGFPAGIITKLMNDEFYTNSVPVVLFKNLILSLHIKPSDVYRAMIPTHKIVIAKETPETLRRKNHGHQLWESEEAVIKYTAHLKSIITPTQPMTLPANSTDMLMDALRRSEIN